MDYVYIAEMILEVYRECGIKEFPIPCVDILKHYEFRTITYSRLKELNTEIYALCISASNDAFCDQRNRIIAYNEKAVQGRIRFSLMHELAHCVFQHTGEDSENEDTADCFASNILAPRVAIRHYGCKNAEDIHFRFGLSYAASNKAVQAYNTWKQRDTIKVDRELDDWLFPLDEFHRNFLRRLRRQQQRRKLQMKQYDQKLSFLRENHLDDVWAQGEEYHFFSTSR